MSDAREYGYDEEFVDNFVLLPDGTEVDFKISKYDKAKWPGSAKIPSGTNMVEVTFVCTTNDGRQTVINEKYILWSTVIFKVAQLYKAIGLRGEGEKVKMQWNKVLNATGRMVLGVREWTGKNGSVKQSNEIKNFIYPSESEEPLSQPSFTQPATGFTPGQF